MKTKREKNGRFKKGFSGNPAGKPVGALSKNNRPFLGKEDEVRNVLLDKALKGDRVAMKLVAERIWPRLRSQSQSVDLTPSDNPRMLANDVTTKLAKGELSPETAKQLLELILIRLEVDEVSNLLDEIKKIETVKNTDPPWQHMLNEKPQKLRKRRKKR